MRFASTGSRGHLLGPLAVLVLSFELTTRGDTLALWEGYTESAGNEKQSSKSRSERKVVQTQRQIERQDAMTEARRIVLVVPRADGGGPEPFAKGGIS